MTEYYDKAGQRVHIGDVIVYGHALGRCAALQYGMVTKFKESKNKWTDKPEVHLIVRGISYHDNDMDNVGNRNSTYRQVPKFLKLGTLQFPSRLLKVNVDQIPLDVYTLVDKERKRQAEEDYAKLPYRCPHCTFKHASEQEVIDCGKDPMTKIVRGQMEAIGLIKE
jgi:hypothetical protein